MAATYASEYDPLSSTSYDPQFTATISNRMQVPESIQIGGRHQSPVHSDRVEQSPRAQMKVPERILLAGDNQHLGMREEFKNLDLDLEKAVPQHVGLSTPPRILTVEDSFPNDDQARAQEENHRPDHQPERPQDRSFLNGVLSMDTSYRSLTPPLPLSAEMMADESLLVAQDDDNVNVKRQIARLQRHVIHLEEENYLRSRREMILYPTLLLYFMFQIGKWFVGRK